MITSGRQSQRSQKGSGGLLLSLVLVVVLTAAGWAILQRRAILDWVSLRNYQPPAAVSQLATEDTMTPYARHIYYVNHPLIESKSVFAGACPSGTEQTVVLGCYHSDQAGIFLLQVSDPQLGGVEQVTAAHETLHAAYDRLSSSKRAQVDGWLMDYYNHGLTDPNLKAQIASYRKTEPHDVVNEMHSLFGTEVGALSPQLEQYYGQYFSNRAAIVNYYNQYESAFSKRITAIQQDDSKLATMKVQISSQEADLKTKGAAIDAQRATMDQERSSNNINAYNAAVPNYNALVNSYNAEVDSVRSLITTYNNLVGTRNSLALEEQQLAQELSGSSVPTSK